MLLSESTAPVVYAYSEDYRIGGVFLYKSAEPAV